MGSGVVGSHVTGGALGAGVWGAAPCKGPFRPRSRGTPSGGRATLRLRSAAMSARLDLLAAGDPLCGLLTFEARPGEPAPGGVGLGPAAAGTGIGTAGAGAASRGYLIHVTNWRKPPPRRGAVGWLSSIRRRPDGSTRS